MSDAPGDEQEAAFVEVAEVPGMEPAVPERLRVGRGIVGIAEEHGRAAHADLPGLARCQATAVRKDRDLHAGAGMPAGAERDRRVVLDRVQVSGQHGNVARDLAEPEILHEDPAELAQRVLLVGAEHRRAGVDDVAQRGMVVPVHRGVAREHGQDRGGR